MALLGNQKRSLGNIIRLLVKAFPLLRVLRSFGQQLLGKVLILFLSTAGSSHAESIVCMWFCLLGGDTWISRKLETTVD